MSAAVTTKPAVRFSALPVVWFEIRGAFVKPGYALNDDGLVRRFQAWLRAKKIYPVANTSSGGGLWIGCFKQPDADRVEEWLNSDGAELHRHGETSTRP